MLVHSVLPMAIWLGAWGTDATFMAERGIRLTQASRREDLETESARRLVQALGCSSDIDMIACSLHQLYQGFHRRDNWHLTSSRDVREGLTYGEIEIEGVSELVAILEFLGPLEESDTMFDLGSGLGKMAVQIFLATKVHKVIGIEFVQERVEEGIQVLSHMHRLLQLQGEGASVSESSIGSRSLTCPFDGRSLAFEYGDFLARDLSDATVVYTCSNSFPDTLLQRLSSHLAMSLAVGSVLVSLRKLPQPHPRLTPLFRLKSVHVTWAPHQGLAFVYMVAPPPPPLPEIAKAVRAHYDGLEDGSDIGISSLLHSWGSVGVAGRRLTAAAALFDKAAARRCDAEEPALDAEGLEAFWCGGSLSKDSLTAVDAAMGTVYRTIKVTWAAGDLRYLPMYVGGKKVLAKVAPGSYHVDNSQLLSSTLGLGHRFSKELDDIDDDSYARWNTTVVGTDEMDGWLRTRGGTCFSPANGTIVRIRDSRGRSLLHEAAFHGAEGLIERLSALGLPANVRDFDGRAPLHDALDATGPRAGSRGLEALLEARADVDARDRAGRTPLHTRVGSEELAELLLAARADANARDGAGRAPLHHCPSRRFADALARHGADPSAVDAHSTPLHSCTGDPDLARGLLAARAQARARDGGGSAPLHRWCARRGGPQLAGVQAILEHRAEVDAVDEGGKTALHWAAASASTDVIRLLIGAGADASRLDAEGKTPLDYARGRERQDLLRALPTSEL
ncbi:unnamed protein product [Prorocentrum cordatum]|uniref:DOT1 domain-containing protein n=1 Tax=Prorocentrum cordatum TaxID=2364126 RepID=A0ABN9T9Z5_9DINO|nr:unnamed protein product [Polarella glacialis]